MSKQKFRRLLLAITALSLVAAACGSEAEVAVADDVAAAEESAAVDATPAEEAAAQASGENPTIAVTTNILGDVVENLVGDVANVEIIMPIGADPHDFQASAQQIALVGDADALIINGAFFEEGIWDVIEAATDDGVNVYHSIDVVETIEFAEGDSHGHDDEEGDVHDDDEEGDVHDEDEEGDVHDEDEEGDVHDEDEEGDVHDDDEEGDVHDEDEEGDVHDDEEGEDGHGHEEGGADPHFFTDPVRMADAVEGISAFLIETVDGIDAEAVQTNADAYIAELADLDEEVADILSGLSDEQRVLVTNHEVFGYFADQYDFEVVGTVIPSGSTVDGTSGGDLAELAEEIEEEGVPAIFSDVSASDQLIAALAGEVGDVQVVELFTESLGDAGSEGATYIDMVRTNAIRIAAALSA